MFSSRNVLGGAIALGILVLAWQLYVAIRLRPSAVTGNDPATYIQMASDLATRGTVAHNRVNFDSLSDKENDRQIFVLPGYSFVRATQLVVPVFAPGFPVLLAFADRIGGMDAMLWLTPLLGVGAVALVGGIAFQLFPALPRAWCAVIGALATLLLATNFKQMSLVLVPMSDVAAQFFCLLALFIAWLQVTYKLIPLQGGSFLIDYYPVKMRWPDFVLVGVTVLFIALLASWIPARKAARQEFSLRSE